MWLWGSSEGILTIAPRGKLPPTLLGLGFGLRLGLVLGFGGGSCLVSEENYPLVRVRFGLGFVLGLGAIFLGDNCSRTVFACITKYNEAVVIRKRKSWYPHVTIINDVTLYEKTYWKCWIWWYWMPYVELHYYV